MSVLLANAEALRMTVSRPQMAAAMGCWKRQSKPAATRRMAAITSMLVVALRASSAVILRIGLVRFGSAGSAACVTEGADTQGRYREFRHKTIASAGAALGRRQIRPLLHSQEAWCVADWW